jgi:hypothetical protein
MLGARHDAWRNTDTRCGAGLVLGVVVGTLVMLGDGGLGEGLLLGVALGAALGVWDTACVEIETTLGETQLLELALG